MMAALKAFVTRVFERVEANFHGHVVGEMMASCSEWIYRRIFCEIADHGCGDCVVSMTRRISKLVGAACDFCFGGPNST